MPWKECKPMDERLKFVARLLDGETMSALCKEFGISRPTGYKIFNRYKELGPKGLEDRSRRPYRHVNKLPFQVERTILALKREYPSWGAPRIREKLIKELPMVNPPPFTRFSTVMGWLSARSADAARLKELCLVTLRSPTACGARTTKESSFWVIASIATH